MRKLYTFLIIFLSQIYSVFASIQGDMKPNSDTIMGNSNAISGGTSSLMPVFASLKNTILGILAIIVVGVFIFLGFKLVSAEGKPDEFKKAMLGFVYAIVGLAIIPLAWVLVKLISSLQF